MDFPDSPACRLLALSDGTVLNQSPVSKPLCMKTVIQSSKLKIAKDYADGEGMYVALKVHQIVVFTLLKR